MVHYSIVDFLHQKHLYVISSFHSITSPTTHTNPFFPSPLGRPLFLIFLPKFQLAFLPFLLQKPTLILLIFLDHHSSLKGDLEEEDTWWFRACFLVVLHPTLGRKVTLQNPHFSFQLMVSLVSFN